MALLWALEFSSLRLLSRLDRSLFDLVSSTVSQLTEESIEVLVLEVKNPEKFQWDKVFETLDDLGAQSVGLSFVLESHKMMAEQSNVEIFAAQHEIVEKNHLKKGEMLFFREADFDGVFRDHWAEKSIESQRYQSLEGGMSKFKGVNPVRINAFVNPNLVPIVKLEEVLGAAAAQKLIEKQHVLITLREQEFPRLRLPQSFLTSESYDARKFHALTLNSFVNGEVIFSLNLWQTLLMTFLLSFMMVSLLKLAGLRLAFLLTNMSILMILILYSCSLYFLKWEIPVSATCLLFVFAYLHVSRIQWFTQQKILGQILLRQSSYLSKRIVSTTALDSQETWTQMANLTRHLLNFDRAIFLEKLDGDHRLKEVVSVDASMDSIKEKRRDFHRSPYKDSIKKGGCFEVKTYLHPSKENDAEEKQFLCPLLYDGEVVGFWAMGVNSKNLENQAQFETQVNDLSDQLARLLNQRRKLVKNSKRGASSWREWLFGSQNKAFSELRSSIQLLMDKHQSTELQMESLSTCTMTYNVFGRVEQVNRQMREVLGKFKIKPFEMTLLDFIMRLTGHDENESREVIREVIMDQRSMFMPATALKTMGHAYQLYIVPLLIEKKEDVKANSAFRVTGVLCELIDLSDVKSVLKLKDILFERLYYKLKNDMELYTLSADMLEQELPPEELREIGSIMHEKIKESVEILDRTKETLLQDVITAPVGCYPIEVREPIEEVIEKFREAAEKTGVKFETNLSDLLSLAQASPRGLDEILTAMVNILLEDSVDDSAIRIETHEAEAGHIVYEMENSGMGMPPERFEACLNGQELRASRSFKILQDAHHELLAWGGRLEGESELGTGIKFKLYLKTVI